MKIESNTDAVIKKLIGKLGVLSEKEKILKEAMFDASALITGRVQQEGLNAKGEKMKSSSKKKGRVGSYSKEYGEFRVRKGFQVDHIDLTYSGDLINSFSVQPIIGGYGIGFRGGNGKITYDDLATYNEDRFGKVFKLTTEEAEFIKGKIIKQIKNALK
jgi:hypothetical protein